jgi:hypothetical protein
MLRDFRNIERKTMRFVTVVTSVILLYCHQYQRSVSAFLLSQRQPGAILSKSTFYCGSGVRGGYDKVTDGRNAAAHTIPFVWVEDADDGFVDHDENLEEGEVCLKAVKAFASSSISTKVDNDPKRNKRFLCAGALIQRPIEPLDLHPSETSSLSSPRICDAWIADSILHDGGPNLQLQGTLQVLDVLLLDFLEREYDLLHNNLNQDEVATTNVVDMTMTLRNFVVKCGNNDDVNEEYTCASFMASQLRGFMLLRDAVRVDSIYSRSHYGYYELDGMVLDPVLARQRYMSVIDAIVPPAMAGHTAVSIAKRILDLLPDDEMIRRHMFKRFSSDR